MYWFCWEKLKLFWFRESRWRTGNFRTLALCWALGTGQLGDSSFVPRSSQRGCKRGKQDWVWEGRSRSASFVKKTSYCALACWTICLWPLLKLNKARTHTTCVCLVHDSFLRRSMPSILCSLSSSLTSPNTDISRTHQCLPYSVVLKVILRWWMSHAWYNRCSILLLIMMVPEKFPFLLSILHNWTTHEVFSIFYFVLLYCI